MRVSMPDWLPYILPIALFLALTQVETVRGGAYYPAIYAIKIALVAWTVVRLRLAGAFPEMKVSWRYLPIAIALGVVLCAMWLGVDRFTPHFKFLGVRAAYDPWQHFHSAYTLYAFLAIRFIGLVAISPVIEELFYRSFVLRFAIDPAGFKSLPVGVFEPVSCAFAVILMAAGHPEWLAAALFSLAMNVIVYRTKSVFACILTHAATNLALGVYIVAAHAWIYW